jgi:predicted methyltransferase
MAQSALADAVANSSRPAADTARDMWRHPVETLEFFGIDPSGDIAEISPGGGYYARILAPWVAAQGGSYTAILGSTDAENPQLRAQMDALEVAVAESGAQLAIRYGALNADAPAIAPPESLDAVLTFRNVHSWMGRGFAGKAFADFHAALRPGGVLGVVEHRLPEDSAVGNTGETGYVRQSHVIALAEAAGFVFEDASEINANPADDADHPMGVWTLPPSRFTPQPGTPEAEGFDRAAYDAIGESDRMTLRFRKPAE